MLAGSFVIFQGTGPVLPTNPLSLLFFRGAEGGVDPVPFRIMSLTLICADPSSKRFSVYTLICF